jgi:hypothetical protein
MGLAMFRSDKNEGSAGEETVQHHSGTIPQSMMQSEPFDHEIFLALP